MSEIFKSPTEKCIKTLKVRLKNVILKVETDALGDDGKWKE